MSEDGLAKEPALLPCPCGKEAKYRYKPWGAVQVKCVRCGKHTIWWVWASGAGKAWNKLVSNKVKVKEVQDAG